MCVYLSIYVSNYIYIYIICRRAISKALKFGNFDKI